MLCELCGAMTTRACEMEDELGYCPAEEAELDPDRLREDRDERRRMDDADD